MSRKIPNFITQIEFEKIFEVEKNKEYRLAFLLGFESGLRISEIVGFKLHGKEVIPPLRKDNVNLQSHTIKVLGKGNKEGIVPLPSRFNLNALNMLPLKVSRRALQWEITKLGNEVLGKKISFHSLRHGFGSHLAGEGRPLHEIQMLMRHARLDTTGIYLHANPKEAIEGAREVF